MSDPMDTDQPSLPLPIEQSLEGVLFPTSTLTSTSTPPSGGNNTNSSNNTRQVSRLSHPPPPIDSPVLSAAQTPSKPPSPPSISMNNMKEDTPIITTTAAAAAMTGSGGVTSSGGGNGLLNANGRITGEGKGAGAPVRQYLNEFVTPYLLEGMKIIARDQPANPLEALGRYLIQQSQIYEATGYQQQQQQQEGGTPRTEVKMEEAA
ncbi:COMPASS (complex proteins associated with Set1p) component [Orbilia javanica]|uniref:COMPASS (Complex proteins associated with Set1p) component n=1 Tax=Orbilia javanica TaxID=47235 RepID=A0AAN8MVG2_9PEZI